MLMKADVAVFRKATEAEYKAFFDLEPKQNPFPLTDRIRGKIYVDRLGPLRDRKETNRSLIKHVRLACARHMFRVWVQVANVTLVRGTLAQLRAGDLVMP